VGPEIVEVPVMVMTVVDHLHVQETVTGGEMTDLRHAMMREGWDAMNRRVTGEVQDQVHQDVNHRAPGQVMRDLVQQIKQVLVRQEKQMKKAGRQYDTKLMYGRTLIDNIIMYWLFSN